MIGKGIFVWNLINCKGGNMPAFADAVRAGGFSWAVIKCADGLAAHNAALFDSARAELESRGIEVYGYQYIYGGNLDTGNSIAKGEADRAIVEIKKLGLELLVIDAEGWYERSGASAWAKTYCETLLAGVPNLKLALCSFRYPSVHQTFPWSTFLTYCHYHMPQVYWVKWHESSKPLSPGQQLEKSYNELIALKDLPFVPVGAAYAEGGWQPTVAEMDEFNSKAQLMSLPGVCWWAWDDHGLEEHADWLAAITAHKWGEIEPPPEPDDLARLTERVIELETKTAILAELVRGLRLDMDRLRDLPAALEDFKRSCEINMLAMGGAINDEMAALVDLVAKLRVFANDLHPPKPTGGTL
jgi:hypothetical protein